MKIPPLTSNTPWSALLLADGNRLNIFGKGKKPVETPPEPAPEAPTAVKPAVAEKQAKNVFHWPKEAMPLKVFYPEGRDWSAIVDQWVLGSAKQVQFVTVTDPNAADIVFSWTDSAVKGRPYEVGHTNNTVNGQNLITKSEIQLLESPLIDKQLAGLERQMRLQSTILHEMGHALGLEHSENVQDVMYFRGWNNAYLSTHDCERIQELYPGGHQLSAEF